MFGYENWQKTGDKNGWKMPSARLWKRLPIIRHVRALWLAWQAEKHAAAWAAMGAIPSGYDSWILYGIFHGHEKSLKANRRERDPHTF